MFYLILFVLLIVFSIYFDIKFGTDGIFAFISIILGSILILLVFSMTPNIVKMIDPDCHGYEKKVSFEIEALQDNRDTSGKVYLRSADFETNLYYYYMRKTGMGFKSEKALADKTYIVYTDGAPYLEYYEDVFDKDIKWIRLLLNPEDYRFDYYYKIYVPEGTVINDFNIDLQ